jgi:hypothetical protein
VFSGLLGQTLSLDPEVFDDLILLCKLLGNVLSLETAIVKIIFDKLFILVSKWQHNFNLFSSWPQGRNTFR